MIALEDHADGVVLSVRARAGARRSGIQGEHDDALKIAVTTAPEKGKANQSIIAVLSKGLGLRKSQIELLSGATSPQKRFLISQVGKDELAQRIERVLNATVDR